jgi:heat shock protein HtpX
MESNLYKNTENNVAKTWLLMSGFMLILVLIGWFLSMYYGSLSLLYVFLGVSIVMNVFSYWFSDKIVLKMARAKEAQKDQYYDLYTIVENLSITAGLPMPKIYVIEESAPNAFATGRNEKKGVVAVTTGLLAILEKNELEGVIAHELAHIKNKDILLQSVVVVIVGLITFVADFFVRHTFFSGGDRNNKGSGVIMVIGIMAAIIIPIIAAFLQLAISRKREFLADASGALITRYPQGLASALKKISEYPVAMKRANHATAHMYISDPFSVGHKLTEQNKKEKVSFFNKIFLTHPPVEERIKALVGESHTWED